MSTAVNRFRIPAYVSNSIRIAAKAAYLKLTNGRKPYDLMAGQIPNMTDVASTLSSQTLSYQPRYHSLTYFDETRALRHYRDRPALIHDVMLAIIKSNGMADQGTIDHHVAKSILEMADSIMARGVIEEDGLFFYTAESFSKFDLKGQRYSGIVQAKAASLFIRCHQLSEDDKYLDAATQCLSACMRPCERGGVLRLLPHDQIWIEEYRSATPSMVLNGFVFCVIALAEYTALYHHDDLRVLYHRSISSLVSWLGHYEIGTDWLYSMYHWDLANVHYTAIQTYQMEHLYQLTGIDQFAEVGRRMRRRTNWKVFDRIL